MYPDVHPLIYALRKARIDQGLSQTRLGDAAGYTASQIAYIEKQTRAASFLSIADIADVLGYKVILSPKGPSQ
jgi:transcriptional regulator with XRE-family HTH domain